MRGFKKLGHVLPWAIVAFAYNFETDNSRNILLTDMTTIIQMGFHFLTVFSGFEKLTVSGIYGPITLSK